MGRRDSARRSPLTSDFVVDLGAVRLLNGGGAPTDRIFADGFEP